MAELASVFVTGAAGVVGRAVCRQLAARGMRVVAHDRRGEAETGNAIERVCGDILDWDRLSAAMRDARCRYVVHLAAVVAAYANAHPREAVQVNVAGTANVCEAAHLHRYAGLVYVSSRSVYGNVGAQYAHPGYERVPEEHPCRPEAFYPTTKRAAETIIERYAALFGLRAVMLRFGAIYGPGKSAGHGVTRFFSEAIEAAARGTPARIGGAEQCEDFVYSEDIPNAVACALDYLRGEQADGDAPAFNIGSGVGVSIAEFAAVVQQATGTALDLQPGIGVMGRDSRQSFVMDDSKATEVLGYRPRYDLAGGVADYVARLRRGDRPQPG